MNRPIRTVPAARTGSGRDATASSGSPYRGVLGFLRLTLLPGAAAEWRSRHPRLR